MNSSMVLLVLLGFTMMMMVVIDQTEAAYNLPAGVQEQIGLEQIMETFKCESDGYFADTDNECKIYHQCNSFNNKGNPNAKYSQSSMACGVGQQFDQSKLTCVHESDAIPCEASSDFFYLNDRIGDPTAKFLSEADIDKAHNARPEYRAARAARAAKKAKKAKKSKKSAKAKAKARAAKAARARAAKAR